MSSTAARSDSRPQERSPVLPLPDDAFLMLDPAVEVLDIEIDECRLLCHGVFEVGMAVPPGEGLLEFVHALIGQPVGVGDLRRKFDDRQLIDSMLASLSAHGFVHVTSEARPSGEELARLRTEAAQRRASSLRRSIVVDLDVPETIDHLLSSGDTAIEVLFRCGRLIEHAGVLATLARARQRGELRTHHATLHTTDARCDRDTCESLVRLGADVTVEAVQWPAPHNPVPGLAEMTRHGVPVHALMTADLSILDEAVRARVCAWAESSFVTGIRLRLDAESLWPSGEVADEAFVEIFEAVSALERQIGDVLIVNLPHDEVLLGHAVSSARPEQLSALVNRFRIAYLRWRVAALKSQEGDNSWSQTPEAEEKVVPRPEDLLPNQPQLLLLQPGSVVADVCGGLGRVARRLAPAVGPQGLVISIEMLRCLSERARYFAGERDIHNVQFRVGLAQRLPLPDATVDAAVNEWTGAIWELGLGPRMVREMVRVVRPGGRIALTHRLVQLPLSELAQPWVQYEDIYEWMRDALDVPELTIVTRRIWGQIAPSLVGEQATRWRKQYVPRLVDPFDMTYDADEHPGERADVFLTIVAQRQ